MDEASYSVYEREEYNDSREGRMDNTVDLDTMSREQLKEKLIEAEATLEQLADDHE